MPEIDGGRITVPIFFYPDHLQMKKQWQTLTDPEDPRASRELSKLKMTHNATSELIASSSWQDPARMASLQNLTILGFSLEDARAALESSKFDADAAVDLLLLSGAG